MLGGLALHMSGVYSSENYAIVFVISVLLVCYDLEGQISQHETLDV